jgi:ATP-dependent RNA helicase DeaD
MPLIKEKLAHLSREELVKQFVSLEFNRFLNYYRDTKDLAKTAKPEGRYPKENPANFRKNRKKRFSKRSNQGFIGIQVNLGKSHKIKPLDLIGLVNQSTRRRDIEIGKIYIDSKKSKLEVPFGAADFVQQAMNGFTFKGKRVAASIQ